MSVQKLFDKHAAEYDLARRQLIPCFDDFYGIALDLIPFERERELRVLDLGSGTGLLAEMVIGKYNNSHITMVDISPEMLDLAQQRFAGFDQGRVSFQLMDYSTGPLQGKYDLVISALSIHHLENQKKHHLFREIFTLLEPLGLFVNADQALGENEFAEKIYQQTWLKQVRSNGVAEDILQGALERMQEDRMAPLSTQVNSLREAGFSEVTTWYQFYSFVVYSGRKLM